jgi:hypothetical protein
MAATGGDVIEARRIPDGTHPFVRVAEWAPMRHYSWIVSQGWVESPTRDVYVAKVEGAGGRWEQAFGGVLHVHVPRESSFDPETELDQCLKSDVPEA